MTNQDKNAEITKALGYTQSKTQWSQELHWVTPLGTSINGPQYSDDPVAAIWLIENMCGMGFSYTSQFIKRQHIYLASPINMLSLGRSGLMASDNSVTLAIRSAAHAALCGNNI